MKLVLAAALLAGMSLAYTPIGAPAHAQTVEKKALDAPAAITPSVPAKPVAGTKPTAAPPAGTAKPAAATAKPAAKTPVKPSVTPVISPRPSTKLRPGERMIGDVTALDVPNDPYVRLDGPWVDAYPIRWWWTSYVMRDTGQRHHSLTLEITHHAELARDYNKVDGGSGDMKIEATQRPSLQCIRNQGGSRICFHTEVYTVTVPEKALDAWRGKGMELKLTGAGKGTEPMSVSIYGPQMDRQMKAAEEVSRGLKKTPQS